MRRQRRRGVRVRRLGWLAFVFLLVIYPVHICQAQLVTFPFNIFTNNSPYADDLDGDMYVDVWDGTGVVNFTFYNNSSLQSSVARIYFDDGSLLGIDQVFNSQDYTAFDTSVTPGDLPGGNLLDPPFVADREFTIGAESPPPWEGVNNGNIVNEWVTVRFNLINGGDLYDVIDELNSGVLRVGLHIIDLPEGYSESALLIPEPATIMLLGLGALVLLRKRRP
jgi:hypothetical protein